MDEFSFADWLTQELKAKHMTGVELSKLAVVSLHSIYKYKDGQRSPTILMANDILNALGKRFEVVDKEKGPVQPITGGQGMNLEGTK